MPVLDVTLVLLILLCGCIQLGGAIVAGGGEDYGTYVPAVVAGLLALILIIALFILLLSIRPCNQYAARTALSP